MTKKPSNVHIAHPSEVEEISRRTLLAGGVSLTAYATLGNLLFSGRARAQTATSYLPARNLIWISMNGGWDILEVTDPKVNSTAGVDVSYDFGLAHPVAGATDGARIGRFLPGIAALGKDLLVVRGLSMGTTSHTAGQVYCDTGILSNAGRVNAASVPSIVASESEATIPIIQLNGGTEPQTDRGLLKPVSVVRAGNLDLYRSMYPTDADALERKMAVLDYLNASVERLRAETGDNDRVKALAAANDKVRGQFATNVGEKLALTNADRALFQSGAPAGMGGGGSDSVALALKLINNGICTCVNLGIGGFDTHQNQTTALTTLLARVDFMVSRLVEGLRLSGKLDQTLIVMHSDFGRTPRVNGGNGRDHWPVGGALIIGGGLDGGRAVGATRDADLQAAELIDPDTGLETTDTTRGIQLNPTHVGGAVLALTLGAAYGQFRPYLEAIPAMTRLRST